MLRVLVDGTVGAAKQARALAAKLPLPSARERTVPRGRFSRLLPTPLALALQHTPRLLDSEPQAILSLSCGRATVPENLALRAATGAIVVHVQRPVGAERHFDLIVAPAHDYASPPPPNVLLTSGSLHAITPDSLQAARNEWGPALRGLPSPRLAVLVGGPVTRRPWQRASAPEPTPSVAGELVRRAAQAVASAGGSLLVSPSPRTSPPARAAASAALDQARRAGVAACAWGGDSLSGVSSGELSTRNPYLGFLAWADYALVTADSVNMVSELTGGGLPVYVWTPEACMGRFAAFHREMLAQRRTRAWPADDVLEPRHLWADSPPVDEAARAAGRLARLVLERAAAGVGPPLEAATTAALRATAAADPSRPRPEPLVEHRVELAPWPLTAYGRLADWFAPLLALVAAAKARRAAVMWHSLGRDDPRGSDMQCELQLRRWQDRHAHDAQQLVWVHGASIGETISTLPIVRELVAGGGVRVLLTASTETALERLRLEQLGDCVEIRPRPVDSPSVMRRFLARWKPDGLLLVESELWPCMLLETRDAGVPIVLVNGRLSNRSIARWCAASSASLRHVLMCVDAILAQSPAMAERLRALRGAGAPAPTFAGDLKHIPCEGPSAAAVERVRASLGATRRPLWLAASTHAAEELDVLEAHTRLRLTHPGLLLLLAPRHPRRGDSVARLAATRGLRVARRAQGDHAGDDCDVYVCDTLGELPALYAVAGIAFVGGSLAPFGGHNLMEAARMRCAVLHGPHVEANRTTANALATTTPPAALCIRDAASLADGVGRLLGDEWLLEASRRAAADAAGRLGRGVLANILPLIREALRLERGEWRALAAGGGR